MLNGVALCRILLQVLLLAVVVALLSLLWRNTAANMAARGLVFSFDFLRHPAGFAMSQHLVPYQESDSYARLFVVGLLNTLLVSTLAIVAATLVGTLVGVLRISRNWLLRKLAAVFVEVFRNIPLLLQLFLVFRRAFGLARTAGHHFALGLRRRRLSGGAE